MRKIMMNAFVFGLVGIGALFLVFFLLPEGAGKAAEAETVVSVESAMDGDIPGDTAVEGQQAAVDEAGQSSVSKEEPVDEAGQNSASKEEPVDEAGQNSTSKEESVNEAGQNSASKEEPVDEAGQNSASKEEPVDEAGQNSTSNEEPVDEAGQNSTSKEESVNEAGQNSTSKEEPADESGQNSASKEEPVDESGQNSASKEESVDEARQVQANGDVVRDEAQAGIGNEEKSGLEEGGNKAAVKIPESALSKTTLSFVTTTLDQQTVTQDVFSDYDITIVHVWGTFCPPCIAEMGDYASLYASLPDNVNLIGIVCDVFDGTDSSVKEANSILGNAGAEFMNLRTSESVYEITESFYYVPSSFFVDREGHVIGEMLDGAGIGDTKRELAAYLDWEGLRQ